MKKILIILAVAGIFGCATLKNPDAPKVQPVKVVEPAPAKAPDSKKPVEKPRLVKVDAFVPESKSKTSNPFQVIEQAAKEAVETVSGEKFLNAITEYEYSEGKIFKIYCAPGRATDLIFGGGEMFSLEDIGDGDTLDQRWKTPLISFSGSGESRRQHLILKPTRAGLEKNMIIPTNKTAFCKSRHVGS